MSKIDVDVADLVFLTAHLKNQVEKLRLQNEVIITSIEKIDPSYKEILTGLSDSLNDNTESIDSLTDGLISRLKDKIDQENG